MQKICINTSISATFIVNIVFVVLYTMILNNFVMAAVLASATTLISMAIAVCKYKFGLYDDTKGYAGNCNLVYIIQLTLTALAVLVTSIITR